MNKNLDDYPQRCLEARAALATAMGWQGVTNVSGQLQGIPPQLQDPKHPDHKSIYRWHSVPDWTGHWGHCASLMIEYDCYPSSPHEDGKYVYAGVQPLANRSFGVAVVDEHPDKGAAIRFAIVKAVTAKLETNREDQRNRG